MLTERNVSLNLVRQSIKRPLKSASDALQAPAKEKRLYSRNKKNFKAPFVVLQLVTNRRLVSVPGRT